MKDWHPDNCVKCDVELRPPGSKGGRPSRFCSEGCKTSAEAEMRRLNVVLRRLENDRANVPLRGWTVDEQRIKAALDKITAVIEPLQLRFDHLAGVPERGDA